jgi:hypothetical protein
MSIISLPESNPAPPNDVSPVSFNKFFDANGEQVFVSDGLGGYEPLLVPLQSVDAPNYVSPVAPSQPIIPNNIVPAPARDNSNRNALIGYEQLLVSANGVTPPKALQPNTYERWVDSAGTATGVFQLATASTIDYVGIAAHNLFSASVNPLEIYTRSTIGGASTLVATITPTSNKAIMHVFETPLDNVAEIVISTTSVGSGIEIGVVMAGNVLKMEQPIYGGHKPQALASKTTYQSTLSDTGQFLGRTVTRKGTDTQYSWKNLTPNFVYGEFADFIESAKTLPFFIKWRPDLFEDAAYCHTTADINPTNQGGGSTRMQVSMSVRGHDE